MNNKRAMPRPRSNRTNGLPPNLYPNGPRAWKYRRPDNGEWHGMGTDKSKAIAAARQLNSILMAGADLVAGVMQTGMTIEKFINDVYRVEIIPPRGYSESTNDLCEIRLRQIIDVVGSTVCDQLTLKQCSALLDAYPPRSSNQLRTRLIDVMRYVCAKGFAPDNVAELTIEKIEKKVRRRHTVEGLAKIREHSPRWLQNAIDLALITTQARAEILDIRFSDIRDGRLHVVRGKTEKISDAAYNSMKVTPQLAAVIQRCRDDIASPFLIHRKPDRLDSRQRKAKKHWTHVTDSYLSHAFQEAREAANPYKKYSKEEQPGFHEIRALALHLYKKAKKAPEERRKLASHTNQKQTSNYESDHEDIVWSESDPDLDIDGIFTAV